MISPEEKEAIVSELGDYYCRPIVNYLKAQGIVNRVGKAHSKNYIGAIMRGERGNEEIEAAIVEFVQAERQRKADLIRRRREMLQLK